MPSEPATQPTTQPAGFASIDALRGFDMFAIGAYGAYMAVIGAVCTMPEGFHTQMNHAPWEGFTFCDLTMPLFLFIVGTAMPFSLGKRLAEGQSKRQLYIRSPPPGAAAVGPGHDGPRASARLQPEELYLFSNTLQAIAVGYLVASLALIHLPVRWQFVLTCVLLLGFWLLMMLVPAPGCPAGTMKPEANLARYVDEFVLRGFRDRQTPTPGSSAGWAFPPPCSWACCRAISCGPRGRGWKKAAALLLAGGVCLALGWIWAGGFGWLAAWRFPIIKHLWTSSMVLWSAGWCYLLLAVFYLVIDVLGFRKWSLLLHGDRGQRHHGLRVAPAGGLQPRRRPVRGRPGRLADLVGRRLGLDCRGADPRGRLRHRLADPVLHVPQGVVCAGVAGVRRLEAGRAEQRPDFFPLDGHVGRGREAQFHPAVLYLQDLDLDRPADPHALVGSTGKHEHGKSSLRKGGPSSGGSSTAAPMSAS